VGKQQAMLCTILEKLKVPVDWARVVRSLAVWYAKQLLQGDFEWQEKESLDDHLDQAVALFGRQSKRAGICPRKALLGLYWPSPALAVPPAPAAAAAAAASLPPSPPPPADPAGLERSFLWQFSGAVVAIACVRKTFDRRTFRVDTMDPEFVKLHYQQVNVLPSGLVKRPRPSVSGGGQWLKLRSSRYASVAGVREEDVSRCLRLLE
jgi:hypothetical protein